MIKFTKQLERYFELHFAEGENSRQKDRAANEYANFKLNMQRQVGIKTLERLEELEETKTTLAEAWEKDSEEKATLERAIAQHMKANNYDVINTEHLTSAQVITLLPDDKLDVRSQ